VCRVQEVGAAKQVRRPLLRDPLLREPLEQPCWQPAAHDAPVSPLYALPIGIAVAPHHMAAMFLPAAT
jgi:hypothetical protein